MERGIAEMVMLKAQLESKHVAVAAQDKRPLVTALVERNTIAEGESAVAHAKPKRVQAGVRLDFFRFILLQAGIVLV